MNRHTSPAESAASEPAVAGIAGIAGVADVENTLRQILQAVSDGQDNRIGPLVEQLGTLIQSISPADEAEPKEVVARIQALWKQASLSLASASHEASTELQRIAAGRSTLRAYRP
jgi:hypothetical protein